MRRGLGAIPDAGVFKLMCGQIYDDGEAERDQVRSSLLLGRSPSPSPGPRGPLQGASERRPTQQVMERRISITCPLPVTCRTLRLARAQIGGACNLNWPVPGPIMDGSPGPGRPGKNLRRGRMPRGQAGAGSGAGSPEVARPCGDDGPPGMSASCAGAEGAHWQLGWWCMSRCHSGCAKARCLPSHGPQPQHPAVTHGDTTKLIAGMKHAQPH